MVTAGVYLVIRFSPIISCSRLAMYILFFGGLVTVVFSSLIALAQYDIKKIIAFSTCSQLGLMFFSCGLSGFDYALYHFFNHAFFKCLLFLLAGAIIHHLKNEQDIRKMGGLATKMPFTFIFFSIASFSLVGMPGFSGATSKDLILHLAMSTGYFSSDAVVMFFLFSTNGIIYLTMAYSARLLYYVFLNKPCYSRAYFKSGRGSDPVYLEPIYAFVFTILAFFSIFGGVMFKRFFVIGAGEMPFAAIHHELCFESIFRENYNYNFSPIIYILTIHAFLLVLYACFYARYKNVNNSISDFIRFSPFYSIFCFFNKKCYFDEIFTFYIVRPIFSLSYSFNIIENNLFNFFTFSI